MKQLVLLALLCLCVPSGQILATTSPDNFSITTDPETEKIGTISGVVYDKILQEPIPFVTVAIKDATGNVITGGITDDDGKFKIKDIPEGVAKITIQYIGYKTYNSEVTISRRNRSFDLGRIELEEDVEALGEVTVIAERTTIEQKLDRKVINVGKDLTTAGPTASDIMNNIPSVSVDQQTGAVALRGNQNVQVMVDGKLSNVPAAQLLRQIPSTSIKKIELITNPSAKYNPEGMSGIINIVLHKNVTIGFNGDVNVGLTYEKEAKFNSGLNLNYRNGKFNFYGSYGGNYSKNRNFGNVFRPAVDIDQKFRFLDDSRSNLFKVGVDFYLNDKNTLSVFTNQNLFDGNTTGITRILDFSSGQRELIQRQNFVSINDNRSSQYNVDYKLDFATDGHNIELEVDYNTFENDEDATFKFRGMATQPNYEDFVVTERDRTTINLDYVNPLTESSKLELGAQARLFNTLIDYNSTGQSLNANGDVIPTPSTAFDYKRDIYSAYVTYGKNFEKWSYQLGARVESVEVKADTNSVRAFSNDYVQVYPSAFLTFTPTEKNQYQVSYSRRVDRPGIGQVNPIREWSTPLISSFGNPNLEPQFTNSIEANYTRSLEKGSITGGVFYRVIEDEINRALFIDRTDVNKVILTHDNFSNTSAYGIELSSNYRPFKWWNFNASFDLFSQKQKGISEVLDNTVDNPTAADIISSTIEVTNTAWNLRMINNFKVTQKLTLSAFGMYRGKNKNIQFEVDPMVMINVGARYSLWDGQGTFSLNYNDIFNSMKFGFVGERPYRQEGEFNWESNTIFAGLSYRFGGGKYRAKSRKRRDSDEKQGSGGIF
ncbi:MAG: outer membrane beta-barrel family protein [Gilvibacter sp.]